MCEGGAANSSLSIGVLVSDPAALLQSEFERFLAAEAAVASSIAARMAACLAWAA